MKTQTVAIIKGYFSEIKYSFFRLFNDFGQREVKSDPYKNFFKRRRLHIKLGDRSLKKWRIILRESELTGVEIIEKTE